MGMFRRRTDGLICQTIGDELLLYDKETSKCHCLGKEAALLWLLLETELTAPQLVEELERKYPDLVGKGKLLVDATLADLAASNLLAERNSELPGRLSASRRKLIKSMGLLLVASVAVPLPTQAQSMRLRIVSGQYFNNQADTPTTFNNCGMLGANASCPGTDITAALQSAVVSGDSLSIACSNANFGDPCTGTLKECRVTFTCGSSGPTTIRVCENSMIVIDCT